jgi:hypothetical protein
MFGSEEAKLARLVLFVQSARCQSSMNSHFSTSSYPQIHESEPYYFPKPLTSLLTQARLDLLRSRECALFI